jgi:hypothetical protein
MNRKLLVIAMVPLLVGFAGAMAFSQWQGTITKTITVQTGTVKAYEKVECVGAHITGYVILWPSYSVAGGSTVYLPPIVLDGGSGSNDWGYSVSGCPKVTECYTADWCGDPGALSLSGGSDPIEFLGPGVSSATYHLYVQYLTPGDWIELLMVDQVYASPGLGGADLFSTLTPGPGLAATVSSGTYTPALAPGFAPAASSGWTWLQDTISNPCRTTYSPLGGALNVGPTTSPKSAIGLEYCDSGPLGPGAPSGSALSPTSPTVHVGGGTTWAYILFGLDDSATGLSNSGMGLCGTLTYVVTASSPG